MSRIVLSGELALVAMVGMGLVPASPATMPTSTLAIECAEALVAWDCAYSRGVTGRELRRLRLGYYDLRRSLVDRVGRAMALGLIEQVLSWGSS